MITSIQSILQLFLSNLEMCCIFLFTVQGKLSSLMNLKHFLTLQACDKIDMLICILLDYFVYGIRGKSPLFINSLVRITLPNWKNKYLIPLLIEKIKRIILRNYKNKYLFPIVDKLLSKSCLHCEKGLMKLRDLESLESLKNRLINERS